MKLAANTDYKRFKAPDFALDPTFVAWVTESTESDFWEKWSKEHPEKKGELENARLLVLALQFDKNSMIPHDEVDRSWERLSETTFKKERFFYQKGNSTVNIFFKVAAILIFTLGATVILNQLNNRSGHTELSIIRKQTLEGQKLSIVLPDSSKVKLNAGSHIEYPSEFDQQTREVTFEGEAYFEITHNAKRPFKVRTGNITTVVRGTSFNVKSYPESSTIQIALSEGKVEVLNGNDESAKVIVLKPGEMLTINKDGLDFDIAKYDQDETLGWKDELLIFDKIDFPDALIKMKRWYGVNFLIDEKMGIDPSWKFHGKFKNKSLSYILDVMSYPNLFKYRIKKDTVVIY